METKTRTRTTEPKLYRVEGPGSAVHFVKALTKAGAVNAVADMIVSEPLSAIEAVELGIAPDRIIDATVQPVRYPLPRALTPSVDAWPNDLPLQIPTTTQQTDPQAGHAYSEG